MGRPLFSTLQPTFICVGLVLALFLSACANPNHRRDQEARSGNSTAIYEKALAAKADGDCTQAITGLERIAAFGRGFEIAQYHLGDCYLRLAAIGEPDQKNALEIKAANWLIKSAQSNNVDAQLALIPLYLNGTAVAQNPIEAGRWFLLFERNPALHTFSAATLDPTVKDRLYAMLTEEDWLTARALVQKWAPVIQEAQLPDRGHGSGIDDSGADKAGGQRGQRRPNATA